MKSSACFSCLLGLLILLPSLTVGETVADKPVVASAQLAAQSQPIPEASLAQGKKLFARHEYAAAQKVFESILINTANQQPKTFYAARLWLAKSLFMLNYTEDAALQLNILLNNPQAPGLDPRTIYSAHFDLASCRLKLGQTLPAALDYLNVGVSAAPAGTENIRVLALRNAKLIASTMLEADEVSTLERVAKTSDLKAFFLNERMQKYLKANNYKAFRSTLPLAKALIASPSLNKFYRQLLESLTLQEKAIAANSLKEIRIGILLPLEFPIYQYSSALPAGNLVYQGIHTRTLMHQIMQPEVLLNTATASTSEETGKSVAYESERLIEKHRPMILLGPIFSNETLEASQVAKQKKIPLISPTATDRTISSGNSWSFQLNPTHEERGRIAARELLKKTSKPAAAGALSEKKPYLEEMAKGFLDELIRAGTKNIVFGTISAHPKDSDSPIPAIETIADMTLDALYLPMDDPNVIDRTLSLLASSQTDYHMLLGSEIWGEPDVISRFEKRIPKGITFFSDYHTGPASANMAEIAKKHNLVWNVPSSSYFWYGYDSLDYLVSLLSIKQVKDGKALLKALREAPVFQAHYSSYNFAGGNVNRSMNVLRYHPKH
ncbi:MAG: ABC transporter substrate-binding protein [Chlorobiaceae bacterium]|nr:ABC transporter substrate-binding protein [Chlorobiaceae bacterium]